MKRITCNLCGNLLQTELTKEHMMFIVKVKSPFCDVKSFKAHICEYCYDDFCRYLKIIGGEEHEIDSDTTPIEVLELSLRTYNILKRHGVNTVGELKHMSDYDIKTMRNANVNTVEEIRKVLNERT